MNERSVRIAASFSDQESELIRASSSGLNAARAHLGRVDLRYVLERGDGPLSQRFERRKLDVLAKNHPID